MGPWDEAELEQLVFHWGEVYAVSVPAPGVWLAQRRDTRETLRAATAEALTAAIRADYAARPVPRDLPGAGRG